MVELNHVQSKKRTSEFPGQRSTVSRYNRMSSILMSR